MGFITLTPANRRRSTFRHTWRGLPAVLLILASGLSFGTVCGAQPAAAQPTSAQPVSAQPVSAQPVSAQPVSAQPVSAQPASTQKTDVWGPLRLLAGSWQGAIDGKLGSGRGVRHYEWIVGEKFLQSRHSSVRLPQEKSPKGDQHEEMGIFSYDDAHQTLVYREFMSEGVVTRYTCEAESRKVVCTSETVEGSQGIRSRLTLEIKDRFRFTEYYEIAWRPEMELDLYFTVSWTRTPSLGD